MRPEAIQRKLDETNAHCRHQTPTGGRELLFLDIFVVYMFVRYS